MKIKSKTIAIECKVDEGTAIDREAEKRLFRGTSTDI